MILSIIVQEYLLYVTKNTKSMIVTVKKMYSEYIV